MRATEAVKRGQLIRMLEMLRDSGVQKPAEWLAGELKAAGIEDTSAEKKPFGIKSKTITPAKLERWRSERNGKSLAGSDRAYNYLRRREKKRERLSPNQAKFIVSNRIWSLLATGF